LKRSRLIAEINTMEQAERVETTVKTGYSEPILEHLIQWIAVEEDLASSYEKMADTLTDSESREVAKKLAEQSKNLAKQLTELQEKFVSLDSSQAERIKVVSSHAK
jgi:rubrerythrin